MQADSQSVSEQDVIDLEAYSVSDEDAKSEGRWAASSKLFTELSLKADHGNRQAAVHCTCSLHAGCYLCRRAQILAARASRPA